MTLQETRELVKKRIETKLGGDIFLAAWDDRRVAWEDSYLSTAYWDAPDLFHNTLDEVCEGTGYFIELINSVEGHLVRK